MTGKAGRSGRLRKPAALKIAEGNRGKRKIVPEPKANGEPEMPDYLIGEQQALWRQLVASLPVGVLRTADSAFVEVATVSWQTFRSARREINRTGLLVRGAQGQWVKNPLLSVAHRAAHDLRNFGADLGLSPSARMRLIEVSDPNDDPMSWLLADTGDPIWFKPH